MKLLYQSNWNSMGVSPSCRYTFVYSYSDPLTQQYINSSFKRGYTYFYELEDEL